VRRKITLQRERLILMSKNFNNMVEQPILDDFDIELRDGALAPGYGVLVENAASAMGLLARFEGQFVDLAYTSKVWAGITERSYAMEIKKGSKILFIHSVGLGGLVGYQDELTKVFN
jgi:1-aminocyclopropane-1-carboxylate deaminase/D-cysteine desulfhydrase-like pyridoxal-dependent ACC family enzyme